MYNLHLCLNDLMSQCLYYVFRVSSEIKHVGLHWKVIRDEGTICHTCTCTLNHRNYSVPFYDCIKSLHHSSFLGADPVSAEGHRQMISKKFRYGYYESKGGELCSICTLGSMLSWSPRAAVPNPRSADRYRSVGNLVPVRRERFIYFNNLFFFNSCKMHAHLINSIYFAILSLFYMP